MAPARFRGVPFHVGTSEMSGGRRVVRHEYPQRDEPFAEDMGRKARTFPVEGYVLGDDYLEQMAALITALEEPGVGELVHPYHGTRRVAVADFRVRQTVDRGGMAEFSVEFVETPAQPAQPVAVVDTAVQLATSAETAREASEADFLAQYTAGATLTASVSGALTAATAKIDSILSTVALEEQQLATLKKRLADFEASTAALLDEPEDLFAELSSLVELLTDVEGLLALYGFDPGVRPPATTANREIERANFDALQAAVQRLAVIAAAELAPDEGFDSYEDAVSTRAQITDLLDEQAETATDDAYPALVQLRADLVRAVPGPDSDLPHLLSHTPSVTVPSLVLAHRRTGTSTGRRT
jgi:prophage DNA circulation protein